MAPIGQLRLAQVANYVGPGSGGLRVALEEIGRAHVRDGGQRLVIVPGPHSQTVDSGRSRRTTIASPRLPGGPGYWILLRRRAVISALEEFRPDVVEVHDQTTLTWVGDWARRSGVASLLFCHERVDLAVAQLLGPKAPHLHRAGPRWATRLAAPFDAVVCASSFAAEPFGAVDAAKLHRIPLGVDLRLFAPAAAARTEPEALPIRRLVFAGRLHPEKAPQTALDVLAHLMADGLPAELSVLGAGPLEASLRARAGRERLPVRFLGHLSDRGQLSRQLAAADVALCPGPRETFGLSVLESMASGTPVIVPTRGASRELVAPGAGIVADTVDGMARAIRDLLADPRVHARARRAARERAEQFPWSATAQCMAGLRSALLEPGGPPSGRPSSGRPSPAGGLTVSGSWQ